MRAWIRAAAPMWVALSAALLLLVAWLPTARADAVLPAPGGWPVGNSPEVLRPFDPPAERWGRGHRGVDLAAEVGASVRAAAAGRVSYAARLAGRGVIVVDHGAVRTTYEPVGDGLAVGTAVTAGTVIGRLEPSSHCAGRSCLHWGLLEGETYRDPLTLVTRAADVRLLPAAARAVAEHRAAERLAAARRASAADGVGVHAPFDGRVGRHGLSRPVSGPISSPYGRRLHPILRVWKLHDGTDFAASCGTPIRAVAAGRVTNRSFHSGYGNRLMIDHGTLSGRRVTTGYNHATRYVVGVGATVRRGQLIGYVGSTGYSTGCHLHLMMWLNGQLSDPMRWL